MRKQSISLVFFLLFIALAGSAYAARECKEIDNGLDPCKASYIALDASQTVYAKDLCVAEGVQEYYCEPLFSAGYSFAMRQCGPAGSGSTEIVSITAPDGTVISDACQCKSDSEYCKAHPTGETVKVCAEACKPGTSECSADDLATVQKKYANKTVSENSLGTCDAGKCYCINDKGSTTTLAGTTTSEETGMFDQIKNAVYKILVTLYCIILFIAAGVAALFIIFTGLKYMSSEDVAGRVEARKRLVYALAGLIFVGLACPLINMLFSGTDIGVDDGTGHKTPCPECPYLSEWLASNQQTNLGVGGGYGVGGDTGGSWFTKSRLDWSKSFKACGSSTGCPAGEVCATTGAEGNPPAEVYRCFPKIADGYSISVSGLKPLSGKDADLCNSHFVSGDKCAINLKCQNRWGCSSSEYCGSDAYCKTKRALSDVCSAGMLSGDTNPDYICQSKWCIGGKCVAAGNCMGPDDCNRHYSGAYCDSNGFCEWKRDAKGECKASQITGGTANDMCKSGTCKATNDKCA